MDCSQPGFSVHGILQARILEWVAIPSSRGSSWPSDQTWSTTRTKDTPSALSTWEVRRVSKVLHQEWGTKTKVYIFYCLTIYLTKLCRAIQNHHWEDYVALFVQRLQFVLDHKTRHTVGWSTDGRQIFAHRYMWNELLFHTFLESAGPWWSEERDVAQLSEPL